MPPNLGNEVVRQEGQGIVVVSLDVDRDVSAAAHHHIRVGGGDGDFTAGNVLHRRPEGDGAASFALVVLFGITLVNTKMVLIPDMDQGQRGWRPGRSW